MRKLKRPPASCLSAQLRWQHGLRPPSSKSEQGTKPWIKPWRGVPISRPLRSCGTPYRGMNTFWLWMQVEASGFASPYWMTYRQVRKNSADRCEKARSRASPSSTRPMTRKSKRLAGGEDTETRRVLKSYAPSMRIVRDDLPAMYSPAPLVEPVEPAGRQHKLDTFPARIDAAQLRHMGKAEEASSLLLRLGGHDERSEFCIFGDDLAEVARGGIMGRSVSYPQGAIVAFRLIESGARGDPDWQI